MPFYGYRCRDCGRRLTLFFESYAAYDEAAPACTQCASSDLVQTIGRVAVAKSEEARLDSLAEPSVLGDLDENDPRSVARWARRLGGEMGEDLGPEFDEMVERMEAGDMPEELDETGYTEDEE